MRDKFTKEIGGSREMKEAKKREEEEEKKHERKKKKGRRGVLKSLTSPTEGYAKTSVFDSRKRESNGFRRKRLSSGILSKGIGEHSRNLHIKLAVRECSLSNGLLHFLLCRRSDQEERQYRSAAHRARHRHEEPQEDQESLSHKQIRTRCEGDEAEEVLFLPERDRLFR